MLNLSLQRTSRGKPQQSDDFNVRPDCMRALLITMTVILSTLVGGYVLFAERVDDGFILNLGNRVYDPVGDIDDLSNRLVRNCGDVANVPLASNEARAITDHLRSLQLGEPILDSVIKSKRILIVESGFTNSEPAIYMLQEVEHGYITRSEWGGTAAPFNDGPVIREYFRKNVPDAPSSLIRCFERGKGQ